MPVFRTAASQETDVRGSENQNSNLNVADEQQRLGAPVGPSGNTVSIVSINGSELTLTGLTSIIADDQGYFLQLFNCADPGNNGNFPIIAVPSPNSVVIVNGSGMAPDANNGSIVWMLRYPYSLEADLNYERSDRKAIKGVDYYETVAPYQQPNAIGTDVPTNLTNISGKTTDAVAYPGSRELYSLPVMAGQSSIVAFDPGQLKHVDLIDTLGIPCFDQTPFIGDFESCFVKILDGYDTGIEFTVISGPHAGERIFGVTSNGASISPDSVEIDFYSCPLEADITVMSSPYTWEVGQTNQINIIYGYNQRADSFDFNILRQPVLSIPIVPTGTGQFLTPQEHQTLRQLIHFIDEGPGDGFASGAYKVISPASSVFPTYIVWYEDITMTKKIVDQTIVWAVPVPLTITWNVYNVDGVTVAHTVSDSITYTNTIFEHTRIRTII